MALCVSCYCIAGCKGTLGCNLIAVTTSVPLRLPGIDEEHLGCIPASSQRLPCIRLLHVSARQGAARLQSLQQVSPGAPAAPRAQAEAGRLGPALAHARRAVAACAGSDGDGEAAPGAPAEAHPGRARAGSGALPWALVALVLSAERRAGLAAAAAGAALEAGPGRHAALLQRIRGRLLLRAGARPARPRAIRLTAAQARCPALPASWSARPPGAARENARRLHQMLWGGTARALPSSDGACAGAQGTWTAALRRWRLRWPRRKALPPPARRRRATAAPRRPCMRLQRRVRALGAARPRPRARGPSWAAPSWPPGGRTTCASAWRAAAPRTRGRPRCTRSRRRWPRCAARPRLRQPDGARRARR